MHFYMPMEKQVTESIKSRATDFWHMDAQCTDLFIRGNSKSQRQRALRVVVLRA